MPRKSRRIYDPALSVEDGVDMPAESSAAAGNLGVGYQDDPLAPSFTIDDEYDEDQERQVTEIVDSKLHNLPLPKHVRQRRNRLRFLAGICALAILVAVMSVSIHKRKQQGNTSRDAASSTSSTNSYLPVVPYNLAAICNPATIKADAQALLKCQQACQPAECCDYPAALALSCLANHEDVCLEYHQSCAVLTDASGGSGTITSREIPVAPGNLPQICSMEALARQGQAGIQACAVICEPQQCCYEAPSALQGEPSCRLESNCAGYAACMHLRAHDTISSAMIGNEIEMKCTQIDTLAACLEVCAVARCCFLGDMDCMYKTQEGLFCEQYAGCENIPGWGPDDQDDGAPTFSPTMMATFEPTMEPTLADTAWTFEPTITAGPTSEGGFGQISNVLPPIPANLTGICATAPRDDDSFFQCDEICIQAECCDLPAKFPQSCLGTQTQLCLQYSLACAPLDDNVTHNEVTLDIRKQDLEDATLGDVCSAESISYTFGLRECRKRCHAAKCCWKRAGERCDDPRCNVYAPCLNLVAMNSATQEIIETVQTACRPSMLKSDTGRAVCESVCLQHKCCYDDSCQVDDPSVCDNYEGCAILFETGNAFTAPQAGHAVLARPTNLQDVCDEIFLTDEISYNNCAAACSAADCCNYPANMDISCLKGNEAVCFTYHRECASLRTRGVESTTQVAIDIAPSNLPMLCEAESLSTESGLKLCENFCYAASCCWLENIPAQDSCVDNVDCAGYASCLNLRAGATTSTKIVQEITHKCTISQIMTAEGRAECDIVCRQHNCCWELGEGSCFREADCRQFDGCELLVDLDQNGIPDAIQVDKPATFPPTLASGPGAATVIPATAKPAPSALTNAPLASSPGTATSSAPIAAAPVEASTVTPAKASAAPAVASPGSSAPVTTASAQASVAPAVISPGSSAPVTTAPAVAPATSAPV